MFEREYGRVTKPLAYFKQEANPHHTQHLASYKEGMG